MFLVDTNILIRFLLPNDPAYQSVRRAVTTLKTRRERVVTTSQNMIEFWRVCTRPTNQNGLGLTVVATEHRIRLLERHFPVLRDESTAYTRWKSLVSAYGVMGKKVHDARIVASMMVHGVPRILTSNVNDFARYNEITAVAPD